MPPLLDELNGRTPDQTQHQLVIEKDQRLRKFVGDIPTFLLHPSPSIPDLFPWLGIARRSLAITTADKVNILPLISIYVNIDSVEIIMIHRPYLVQSFQRPQYAFTHKTCVSAATTILREHQRIADEDDISIWTHSAFCITAVMVLGLELLYPRKDRASKAEHYRELLIQAKERLDKREGDVMADRGVRLIDTILQEAREESSILDDDPKHGNSSVDFRKVLTRFLTLDDHLLHTSELHNANQVTGTDLEPPFPISDDFDIWLNQIFGYAQV